MAGMFRNLRADEVQVRVQRYTKKGAHLLIYKDSRADMTLLDETVGPTRWKSHHSNENHNCTIEIRDDATGEWVSKEGVGDAKEGDNYDKSLASDSFKRAGVLWGIGRELYNLHDTFVPCNTVYNESKRTYEPTEEDKWKFFDASVSELEFDHDIPTRLVIVDNYGNVLYTYGQSAPKAVPKPEPKEDPKPKSETKEKKSDLINDVKSLMEKLGTDEEAFLSYYSRINGKQFDKVEDMTVDVLRDGRNVLLAQKRDRGVA